MQEYFGNLSILISYLKYVENLFNLLKIFLSKKINIKFFKVWTKVRRSCFNSVTVHFLWIPVTGFLTEQYTRWNLLLDWIEHFSSTKYVDLAGWHPIKSTTVSVWHLSVCVWPVMSNSLWPWILAFPAPLSMEFSRQEHCSGLLFPTPGDLPYPGIKPSFALQADSSYMREH